MAKPDTIVIDGHAFSWKRICELRKAQLEAWQAAQAGMTIFAKIYTITDEQLAEYERRAYMRGYERGRFEESCARSNSQAQGSEGHSGATENMGSVPSGSAVRPANSQ